MTSLHGLRNELIDPNEHADGAGGYFSQDTHLDAFKELWHNASDVARPLSVAEARAKAQAVEARRKAAEARRILAAVAATSRTPGNKG